MIRFLTTFCALVLLSVSVQAKTISVPAGSDLGAVLKQLSGGETLALEPGSYPPSRLSGAKFGKTVTLTSANPKKRAVLKGLHLRSVANIAFDNLHFKYDPKPGDKPQFPRPFLFESANGITITRSLFEGGLARDGDATQRGYAVGKGLFFNNSSQIKVEGNEFKIWTVGAVFHHVDRLNFSRNDLHSIRSDGFNCSQLQSAFVGYNHFHDFKVSPKSKDHPDMIQCWSSNSTRPMDGLTIQGNVLNSGSGRWTQSIFLRNEGVDKGILGPEYYYQNVTIKENVVINAHLHGITLGHSNGVVIENNTIVRTRASAGADADNVKLHTPILMVNPAARNVVIRGNVVGQISGYEKQRGWQVSGNQMVQDQFRLKPGFYGKVFANPPGRGVARMNDFALRPDGILGGQAIGAPRLRQ